jgi:hypothetical protein
MWSVTTTGDGQRLGPAHLAGIGLALACGALVRLVLLPTEGVHQDMDVFALWTHHAATTPLGEAYRTDISFPAVMAWVFWLLGALAPVFQTATDASTEAARAALKLPASLADLGIALGIAYLLRGRPRWAVAGAWIVALFPAFWYLSAWWGQFESLYVLPALIAVILAIQGRQSASVVVLAVALMTKPQALPIALPFAAWYLARLGPRGFIRMGAVGLVTVTVLWLPFLADGGPVRYAANLAAYQGDDFAVLSLRAWNFWWLVQDAPSTGSFLSDLTPLVGPFTPRHLAFAIFGAIEVLVFRATLRSPTPRTLVLAIATSGLAAFMVLTTMHERYSFPALVFLLPLLPERRFRWAWPVIALTALGNILATAPAFPELRLVVSNDNWTSMIGSVAMIGGFGVCLHTVLTSRGPSGTEPADEEVEPVTNGDQVPAEVVR